MKLQSLSFAAVTFAITMPAGAQMFTSLVSGRDVDTLAVKASVDVFYASASGTVGSRQNFQSPVSFQTAGVTVSRYDAEAYAFARPEPGLEKDYGSARVQFAYMNGGSDPDNLRITLEGHGSAEMAQVSKGGLPLAPADLDIHVVLGWVLLGDPAGGTFRLGLPAVPSVGAMEHLDAWLEGGGGGAVDIGRTHFPAGSPAGSSVDLDARGTYAYVVAYDLHVPFGTDPDFSYVFDGGTFGSSDATPVPEPGEWAVLLGAGCVLWALARRSRI